LPVRQISLVGGEPLVPSTEGLVDVECWRDYLLTADEAVELPRGLGRQLSQPDEEVQRYIVNFGDYVGRLRLPGLELLIQSPKLDSAGFDALLREITGRCSNLPFDFNSPTFIPYERQAFSNPDLLYHAFAYLRWAMWFSQPTLQELLALIERDPHRTLIREDVERPAWEARDVTPRALEYACSRAEGWRRNPGVSRGQAVHGHRRLLPTELLQHEAVSTFDTPENRFVRYFIVLVGELSEGVARQLSDADPSIAEDAVRLRQIATEWTMSPFLSEVGALRYFPAASQVLQNKVGYRELLRHYLALILAARYPVDSRDLELIMESKSASVLYEYWTYFTLAEAVRHIVGDPVEASTTVSDSELSVSVRQGISIRYPGDVELFYNRSFRGGGQGSYSLALRPDITLQHRRRLHLFDAKFRVDFFSPAAAEEMDVDAELGERPRPEGWFKQADIHKMHAYRDAIGSCHSPGSGVVETVWVLYPGTEWVFYDVDAGRMVGLAGARALSGVGAIPMLPQGENRALTDTLAALLPG
jgi:uncharacterized protein